MKFLIDLDIGIRVEEYLIKKNYNVKCIRHINPRLSDEKILEIAVKEQRMVITMDKDFGELVYNSKKAHEGILLLRLEDSNSKEKVNIIKHILNNYFEKLQNNFCVYQNGKLRIRKWENVQLLTFAFNQKNTFIILKQINDICLDRIYYYGTILPAIEHFFVDWFSLRAGIEGSYALLNDSHNLGFGILSGITFRSGNFDIDINISYRLRPSRMVEELLYPDFNVLIILTWNDVFISR